MKRVAAILVLLIITCVPKPRFLPEEKFSVRPFVTEVVPMHRSGDFRAINALVEARNPTNQDLLLYAGCEFSEDENIFATTVTKILVRAQEIKIFKLNTPVVGPFFGRSSITIHCRYETKRVATVNN